MRRSPKASGKRRWHPLDAAARGKAAAQPAVPFRVFRHLHAFGHLQLPVISRHGRWLMSFRGRQIEFIDRSSALQEAIRQAYQFSKDGAPTQVICLNRSNRAKVIWTYGVDPEPR